jgi:hypothetical protein
MKNDFFKKFAFATLSKEMSAKLVGGRPCQVIDCGGLCTRTESGGTVKECCDGNGACWTNGKVSIGTALDAGISAMETAI